MLRRLLLLLLILMPVHVLAQSQSDNYQKVEKLLPGEEVVTPTGRKMRVWSTEGPVPVQAAPEPFQQQPTDPGRSTGDVHVVVPYQQSPTVKEEVPNRKK